MVIFVHVAICNRFDLQKENSLPNARKPMFIVHSRKNKQTACSQISSTPHTIKEEETIPVSRNLRKSRVAIAHFHQR